MAIAALAQPLAVVLVDRAHRHLHLLGGLEHRRRQLGSRVAVLVPVDVGGPAVEEVREAVDLDAQVVRAGAPLRGAPAALELEVQADLDPARPAAARDRSTRGRPWR